MPAHYPVTLMHARRSAATLTLALLFAAFRAEAADDATLLRVFLKDGTSLVSYGEPARVEGRVIFSMTAGSMPIPPLHLADIAVARADWERTGRYPAHARATGYLHTQAENDYAAFSNDIA